MQRYGIIGCGMMGQEHLRNIALLDGASVAAIFEPDPGMRAAAAALAPGARMVGSVAEVLAVDEVELPADRQPEPPAPAASWKKSPAIRPLPILCEKPLFTDPADAPRLAALRAAYPAPIWVAMEYRYMPPVAHLLREAPAATGGIKMLTIREHRFPFLAKVGDWNRFNRNSGGTLVEKCCHFFDLMRLVAGCNPVRIMASGGQAVNHLDEVYDGQTPGYLGPCLCDRRFRKRHAGDAGAVHVRRRQPLSGRDLRRRPLGQDRVSGARPGPVLARASGPGPGAEGDRQPAQSRPGRSSWIFRSTRRCWRRATTTGRPSTSIRAFRPRHGGWASPRFR